MSVITATLKRTGTRHNVFISNRGYNGHIVGFVTACGKSVENEDDWEQDRKAEPTCKKCIANTLAPLPYEAIGDVIAEECGASPSMRQQLVDDLWTGIRHYPYEFRFMGSLGFGGKFRVNLNEHWYVDNYPEDRTPERDLAIKRANERLAALLDTHLSKLRLQIPNYDKHVAKRKAIDEQRRLQS